MQAMNARGWRQSCALMLALFVIAACGESATREDLANPAGRAPGRTGLSMITRTAVFAGVVADESKAAEAGRDILMAGGNAVDAAVAMYFAQAVTLPSSSSLGAAGVCLTHNSQTRVVELFGFPPVAAPGPIGGAPFIVPMGVRAITLMHIRQGKLRFEQVVAPAERLARYGVQMSPGLVRDLQASGILNTDAEARRVFGAAGGNLVQPDLTSTLANLRQSRGVDFFQGRIARVLADQVAQMGGNLPFETLRGAVPITAASVQEDYRGFRVHAAPPPFAGAAALAAWNGRGDAAGSVGGSASFVAIDSTGGAAACALSMGQPFGIRRIVPGTGIVLGAATPDAAALSALLIVNPHNAEMLFAGGGTAAVGAVARSSVQGNQTVQQVLNARGGRGGLVNAMACPRGLRNDPEACTAAADPAGFGLVLPAIPVR